MTNRPISDPLAGERLLAVVPAPGTPEEVGRRRLHLFSGRALSDSALREEQAHRAEWLRQLARLWGAGVVRGLEVSEEQPHTLEQAKEQWLQVGAGLGLSVDGADVWLPRPLRIRFADLPRLDNHAASPPPNNQRLWILVLQPVSVLETDAMDPNRCSEWDESGRAFEAETCREGVRLGVVPFNLPLPVPLPKEGEGEGRLLATRTGHIGTVTSVSWSPDGTRLVSGGWGDPPQASVRVWDPMSGEKPALLRGDGKTVTSVSWSPDGTRLASAGRDGTLRLWNPLNGQELKRFTGHTGWVFAVSWGRKGTILASAGRDGTLRLWNPLNGQELKRLTGHLGPVRCVCWSPDGKRLASGGDDGTVRLWAVDEGKEMASLRGHDGPVRGVSWSPDGTRLASGGGGDGGTVLVWKATSENGSAPLAVLKGHTERVTSVSWSWDGSRLASGGRDGSVRVWKATSESGSKPLAELRGHKGRVTSVSWSPDGSRLVSGGGTDATVRVWLLATHEKRWRNALFHSLLAWEQQARNTGQALPWDALGVPIALIALTPDRQRIAFVDGASVVRQGGRPREGTAPLQGQLASALVRARLRQFAEQMAELPPSPARATREAELWLMQEVLPRFRYLPPFGLLPLASMRDLTLQTPDPAIPRETFSANLTTRNCLFFPDSWCVHLAPIPQEQLELTLRDSAELAPYDLQQPDQVQLWVPVPQAWYEPDLLLQESVDPLFENKRNEFTTIRNDWLARRSWLRRRLAAISRAITGKPVNFAVPDPGQLDDNEPTESNEADGKDPDIRGTPPEVEYGTVFANGKRSVQALEDLREALAKDSPLDTDAVALLTKLDSEGHSRIKISPGHAECIQKKGIDEINKLVPERYTYDTNTGLLTVRGVMSSTAQQRFKAEHTWPFVDDLFDREDVIHAIDSLAKSSQDNNILEGLKVGPKGYIGLAAFLRRLEAKTLEADDSIEFGFLQVRTSMYRIRQQVMGQEDAMRLATSTTLAGIATRETARASQADLKSYFQKIKAQPSTQRGGAMASAAPAETLGDSPEATALPEEPQQPAGGDQVRAFSLTNMVATGSPTASLGNLSSAAQFSALQKDVSLFQREEISTTNVKDHEPADTVMQSPLIGWVPETITVGERLGEASVIQTRNFVINDRISVLDGMGRQGLFKDVLVPGQENLTFGMLQPGGRNLTHTAPDKGSDEIAYFSNGLQTLDLVVAALRLAEGRVQQYRLAIARCQETLLELRRQQGRLEERLRVVVTELAEARQDVSVAQALLAEEKARVAAINDRRSRILRDQVPYLAFQRPRSLELRQAPPWLPLDPGPSPDPLPPCLQDSTPIPREVRAMVELLREAPLGWFTHLLPGLRRMDRIDTLVRLFNSAAQRRALIASTTSAPLSSSEESDTPIGRSINRLYGQRQQLLRQSSLRLPPQVPQAVARQSWQESLQQAERILTLGDLLAGDHHRPELSSQAAALLERWCRVSTCLKERFTAIEPRLRLDWAERLSQFDGPVNLRVLTNLPRWGQVRDVRQRRALQSLVDWLFQQVNSAEEQALAFANDLVRLSLLLACHAPVNQILSGRVIGTRSLAPEARLPIRMDPLRVRIGMPVLFHAASGVVAEGIVEDLSGSVATARILRGNATLTADANTRVQFLRQPLT